MWLKVLLSCSGPDSIETQTLERPAGQIIAARGKQGCTLLDCDARGPKARLPAYSEADMQKVANVGNAIQGFFFDCVETFQQKDHKTKWMNIYFCRCINFRENY